MPEPTSARADRARSPMSKTAAKRQAHRESAIYRWEMKGPKRWTWRLVTSDGPTMFPTRTQASRALAAWRAARVRELMGEPRRG